MKDPGPVHLETPSKMFDDFLASLVEEVGSEFTDEDAKQIKRMFFTGLYTGIVSTLCIMTNDDDISDELRMKTVENWMAYLEDYFLEVGMIDWETFKLARSKPLG